MLLAMATFLLGSVVTCRQAEAQTYDHLQCFKIRDQKTFKQANVDLSAVVPAFGLSNCTVRAAAKEYCVPVSSNVTSIEQGTTQSVPGDSDRYGRLCYKLKCPSADLADQTANDVFGSRAITRFKAVKLCTPAVLDSFPLPTTTLATTTTTTTTTTLAGAVDDTFSGSSLGAHWSVLNPSGADLTVSGGTLTIDPTSGGQPNMWFNDGQGILVYQEVTGDFDVRTVISTRSASAPANPPQPAYRLGGILARDPASTSGDVNTAHVALGVGSAGQGVSYEYKSTDGSVSDWMTTPTGSADGELRLARVGTMVTMYWRATSGDSWLAIQSFNRADLPSTVQVGLMAYGSSDPADILAIFDEVVFDVP